MLDWADLVEENPEWLGDDKVHVTDDGAIEYGTMIAEALALS